ncbi:protein YIPF1 isoform X3 [Dermacentor variabilis]|uniref:protein YIPF1 isoform X3 n=1 Tax=Dermacentor variabilis TaxID=34621 RepID=UPI003F5B6C66
MAAPITAKIIDFDGDQSEAQANLQFQDFSDTLQGSSDQRSRQAVNQAYTSFSDMNDDEDESDELQLLNRERDASAPSFWKFSYYQSLFDVTTNDVLRRLLWSAIPQFSSPSYLEKHIRPNPDLYGPIWVGLTLVVTTSVSSNVASYLETAGQSKDFWHTDYTRVSFASTAIMVYMFMVPLVLWAVLKYRKVESRYSLLETLCLYGYSLAIYVPISDLYGHSKRISAITMRFRIKSKADNTVAARPTLHYPVGCAPDLAAVDIGCRGCFALWLCPGHHFVAFLQGRLPQDGHHHVCCCICITCITGSWLCEVLLST